MATRVLALYLCCVWVRVACLEDADGQSTSHLSWDEDCSPAEASAEGLALLQVDAKKLEKVTATPQNAARGAVLQKAHVAPSTVGGTAAIIPEIARSTVGNIVGIIILMVVIAIVAGFLFTILLQAPGSHGRMQPGIASTRMQPLPSTVDRQTSWPAGKYPSAPPHQFSSPDRFFKQSSESPDEKTLVVTTRDLPSQTHLPPVIPKFPSEKQLTVPFEKEANADLLRKRPPPLYRDMILPQAESYFGVPIDQILAGNTSVEIIDISGNALLQCTLKYDSEGRVIEMSMAGENSPHSAPVAIMREAPDEHPSVARKEVKMCKGKFEIHYGWVVQYPGGEILQCGGEDMMRIVTNPANQSCQLYACGSDELLGQACRSCEGDGRFNANDLEVRVVSGMDGMLALLCVISLRVW